MLGRRQGGRCDSGNNLLNDSFSQRPWELLNSLYLEDQAEAVGIEYGNHACKGILAAGEACMS